MENGSPSTVVDVAGGRGTSPLESIENRTAGAFTLAGTLLLASLLVPAGLSALVGWGWLAGIVLVGLAVVSVAVGLLGLYPGGVERAPTLARAGALWALVAGAAGLVVLAMSGLTAAALVLPGVEFSLGVRTFAALSLATAGAYALGFLSFGLVGLRSDERPGRTGRLLAGGGLLLLGPVVGELSRLVLGIGPPPWILFPVLGLVAVDTLAVGIRLRRTSGFGGRPAR